MDIEIRHAEPGDHLAIRDIHAQPRVIRGTLQLPLPSAELWRKRLADKPAGMYSLVACVEGEVRGTLGLELVGGSPRRRHAGFFGMSVHDAWQGRGIGSALLDAALDLADNWLNLHRLELQVFTDNEPAIRLYRKKGFEVEGTLRQYAFREGRFDDVYFMARLRPPR